MCNQNMNLTQLANQRVDELLANQNIDDLSQEDFRNLGSDIIDFVNNQIAERFPHTDGSDSGIRATEESRVNVTVARHMNNLSSNFNITFDGNLFTFIRSRI